jgi:hypothetical protein
MSNDVQGDAILIQPVEGDGAQANYLTATAIIRRVDSPGGRKWYFNNLMNFDNVLLPCVGMHGDIEAVVRSAQYQFGDQLFNNDFVAVSYTDAKFPQQLIP